MTAIYDYQHMYMDFLTWRVCEGYVSWVDCFGYGIWAGLPLMCLFFRSRTWIWIWTPGSVS